MMTEQAVDGGKLSPNDPASLAASSRSSEERKKRAISAKSHVFRRGKIEAAREGAAVTAAGSGSSEKYG